MHCARCFFYETDVGDDVCDRCGRAYLPEANVYLGIILLVTGGAAWTLRNLLTGEADPFVRPTLGLGLWATWPVSLVDCPAYGLVVGAWLAMMAAAPVLAGIMYGKRGGWLTAIVIAVMGPDPLLAAAAALGVWIAAGWTLRLQSKLASAMLGLVPSVAYWFVATAMTDFGHMEPAAAAGPGTVAVALKTLAPALRSLAYVPPITGVLVAAVACLLVVVIGRADRWHVRWPAALTAILVTGPVLALAAFVGVDEIRYGLYQDAGPPVIAGGALAPMTREKAQMFLARHPSSPRAAEVRARLAMELEQLENAQRPGDAPRKSDEIWQELLARHPESPWAADARLHLGDAAARQGLFAQAEQAYRRALAQTTGIPAPTDDPMADCTLLDLFSIGADLRDRQDGEHLRSVHYDTLIHLAIIMGNQKGTQNNSRALALYFVAQGFSGTNSYRTRLRAVVDADPGGPLIDNVAYDLAMCEPDGPKDLARIEALKKTIAAYPGTDGELLAHVAVSRSLIRRAASDPGAMREARQHLTEAHAQLARRGALNPNDPYVKALAETVDKGLVNVQTQLRTPGKGA
jgi:tetratricopeptide (TPR) repeat protein